MDFQAKIKNFLAGAKGTARKFLEPATQAIAPIQQAVQQAPQAVGGFAQTVFNRAQTLPQQIQAIPQAIPAPKPRTPFYNILQSAVPFQQAVERAPLGALIRGDLGEAARRITASPALKGFRPDASTEELADAAVSFSPAGVTKVRGATSALKPPTQVSGLRQLFDRTRNIIESQGPSGQQVGRMLQQSRDLAETTAGNWISRLPTVRSLSKKDFENFVDVVEGAAKPLSKQVAQAAAEWKQIHPEVYNTAKATGIDLGYIENYFPHRYDESLFKGDNWKKAIDHLISSGQASDELEAARKLRHAQDVLRNRRQGNLEFERLVNLPGYKKNKEALFDYLESAANRIAQVNVLGPDDTKALALINRIADEGGDASTAKELFDIAVGAKKYGELQQKVSGGLRAFQGVTKLGLSAIANSGQLLNTASVVGIRRTLANIKAPFKKEGREYALKAGVTLDGVLRDLREGAGFSGQVMGKLTAPLMNPVEKFNRTVTAWAGRGYAEDLVQQAIKGSSKAKAALSKMGLDAEGIVSRGGKLSEEEVVKASRNLVERTQFKVNPQDLPGWASSPWGKVVAQFRTFGYNQSAFFGREILAPAARGDFAPLARFMVLATLVGSATTEARNTLRNRKTEEDTLKRLWYAFQGGGGVGLAGDVANLVTQPNANYLGPERQFIRTLGTIGGPTVSDIADTTIAGLKASAGKPEDLGRLALKKVPIVGPTLQQTIAPYGKTQRFGPETAAGSSTNSSGTSQVNPQDVEALLAQALADDHITNVEEAQLTELRGGLNKQLSSTRKKDTGDPVKFLGFTLKEGYSEEEKESQLTDLESKRERINKVLRGARASIGATGKPGTDDVITEVTEKHLPGDPEFKRVVSAIVMAESGGDPNKINNKGEYSVGLLQANMQGGRGTGYSLEQLLDPRFNLELGMQEIVPAYQEGRRQGLTGPELAAYVSRVAQRPAAGLEQHAARAYGLTIKVEDISRKVRAGELTVTEGRSQLAALRKTLTAVNKQAAKVAKPARVRVRGANFAKMLKAPKVKPLVVKHATFKRSQVKLPKLKGKTTKLKVPKLKPFKVKPLVA